MSINEGKILNQLCFKLNGKLRNISCEKLGVHLKQANTYGIQINKEIREKNISRDSDIQTPLS